MGLRRSRGWGRGSISFRPILLPSSDFTIENTAKNPQSARSLAVPMAHNVGHYAPICPNVGHNAPLTPPNGGYHPIPPLTSKCTNPHQTTARWGLSLLVLGRGAELLPGSPPILSSRLDTSHHRLARLILMSSPHASRNKLWLGVDKISTPARIRSDLKSLTLSHTGARTMRASTANLDYSRDRIEQTLRDVRDLRDSAAELLRAIENDCPSTMNEWSASAESMADSADGILLRHGCEGCGT
jgi:hypothetical protein